MKDWLHLARKLREELLNGEIFDALLAAQVLVERWRKGGHGHG
jgi:hypothetical protein